MAFLLTWLFACGPSAESVAVEHARQAIGGDVAALLAERVLLTPDRLAPEITVPDVEVWRVHLNVEPDLAFDPKIDGFDVWVTDSGQVLSAVSTPTVRGPIPNLAEIVQTTKFTSPAEASAPLLSLTGLGDVGADPRPGLQQLEAWLGVSSPGREDPGGPSWLVVSRGWDLTVCPPAQVPCSKHPSVWVGLYDAQTGVGRTSAVGFSDPD